MMTMLASQITSLMVVYSIVYSGVNQRKHQSSASLAFVREIHRGPVNFPHKWPVTRKMFPFDDVIMDENACDYVRKMSTIFPQPHCVDFCVWYNSDCVKGHVRSWELHSYLTGVTAAELLHYSWVTFYIHFYTVHVCTYMSYTSLSVNAVCHKSDFEWISLYYVMLCYVISFHFISYHISFII